MRRQMKKVDVQKIIEMLYEKGYQGKTKKFNEKIVT